LQQLAKRGNGPGEIARVVAVVQRRIVLEAELYPLVVAELADARTKRAVDIDVQIALVRAPNPEQSATSTRL
jgi:hypothetical protein